MKDTRKIDNVMDSSWYAAALENFLTHGDIVKFLDNPPNQFASLNKPDLLVLLFIASVKANNYSFAKFCLDNTIDGSDPLTTIDNTGYSALSYALTTSTSEEILALLKTYIDTHRVEKVRMDEGSVTNFSFSVSGGEYYSREETIKDYLAPLYDDAQVQALLGAQH